MSRRIPFRRAASGFAAAAAAIGLVALGPVAPAQADSPVDQVTGNGVTASAVTVAWGVGLLGADNTTVVQPRDPTSPYTFMHHDFQGLTVTVGQTENIVHQAIKVSWSGGKPTAGTFNTNYLQLMECYGDANTGPQPENCEFGSAGLNAGFGNSGIWIGSRNGGICTSHTPDVANPPGTVDGSPGTLGCDPSEPTSSSHLQNSADSFYSVPFIPVDTTDRIYPPPTNLPFNRFNSNEVQQASTRPDGTGEVFFQAFTRTEAPGLGCGELESNNQPRDCWLVIVPRGEYQPNGARTTGELGNATGFVNESPLGAASWAQRIQIHLNYAPIQPPCPIGAAKERQTLGTQLVSRAVFSWQLALNTAAGCRTLYGYSSTPEASSTSQVASDTGIPFAFTTVPIGDEAVRDGRARPTLPPLVYAPVAVSAITFGFNINLGNGVVSTPVKLTPRLLAKALTQSYKEDLTDFTSTSPGPSWVRNNPLDITRDPEFVTLNPQIGPKKGGAPVAPLLTADRSGVNAQVWAWIRSDPAARAWLGGTPDGNGMLVNPNYQNLKLDQTSAVDSFPRADPTCLNTYPQLGERDPGRCTIDLLPYVENFDDGTSRVRAGNNPEGADWDPNERAPDGSAGWWKAPPTQLAGSTMLWTLADSANLASYGLVAADLCNADGTGCVSPTAASVTTAVSYAKAGSGGLLRVDPATPGPGGYPLVSVVYAAVRTNQDAAALTDYASLIRFAVNQGQTPGVDPGQLPHGYLPLPAGLRTTAMRAVATLLARGTTAPTATGTGTGGAANGAGRGGVPNGGAALPATGPSGLPYLTSRASPVPAAKATSGVEVGAIRWALLSVLLVGLGGSVGGPLLRLAASRRPVP